MARNACRWSCGPGEGDGDPAPTGRQPSALNPPAPAAAEQEVRPLAWCGGAGREWSGGETDNNERTNQLTR